MSTQREIANTIRDQITKGALMRVGARRLTATLPGTTDRGGLQFLMTATTKGGARRVMFTDIVLTGADDYTVEFWKTKTVGSSRHRYASEVLASFDGIHAGQLARLIQTEAGEFRSEATPSWESTPVPA